MEAVITVGLVAVGVAALVWPVWFRLETRAKRRRDPRYSPPHMMGILDEIYHPTAYSAIKIVEVETRAPAPAPLPGDPEHIPVPPASSAP